MGTTASTPLEYAMIEAGIPSGSRCQGFPSSGGWGGLGRDLRASQCQDACLKMFECAYAVYNPRKKLCSSFVSCSSFKIVRSYLPQIWAKATMFVSSVPIGMRCKGKPESGWAGLGTLSQPNCMRACLQKSSCKFVIWNSRSKGCSSYTTCSEYRSADWLTPVWERRFMRD